MRPLLLLGALGTAALAPEVPTLSVENGTEVTKSFTSVLHLELDSVELTVNGDEQDAGEVPEVTIHQEEETVFIDTYVTVEDGRLVELVRNFDTLRDSSTQSGPGPDGETSEETRDGESELEGATVRFKWDADDEDYVVSYADEDDEGSAEALEDLEADADYLYLLPGDDVEVGDSWELDAELFDRFTSPGGDLKIYSDESDRDGDFSEQFEDNLSGVLEAKLESIEDGVATIAIEGEVTTSVEEDDVPEGAPAELELVQTYEFVFEVEATLLWDMEAGRATSFELNGDVSMNVIVDQSMGENELHVDQGFVGTLEYAAAFE